MKIFFKTEDEIQFSNERKQKICCPKTCTKRKKLFRLKGNDANGDLDPYKTMEGVRNGRYMGQCKRLFNFFPNFFLIHTTL